MVFLMVSISSLAGCKAGPAPQGNPNTADVNQLSHASAQQRRELVKTFAEDQGPLGGEALRKLQTFPQPELISRLVELERTVAPDDKLRPQVAFLFCWLDHEYASNVKLIQTALSKTSKYNGFYADDAQMMLDRLIQHGHKDLLSSLFEAAPWADGALAEGLADTFARELKANPEAFLTQLSTFPQNTRKQTYMLIQSGNSYNENDLGVLRKQLSSIPKTSAIYEPANELLRALSGKASH